MKVALTLTCDKCGCSDYLGKDEVLCHPCKIKSLWQSIIRYQMEEKTCSSTNFTREQIESLKKRVLKLEVAQALFDDPNISVDYLFELADKASEKGIIADIVSKVGITTLLLNIKAYKGTRMSEEDIVYDLCEFLMT
jgi:hypothetical protein